MWDTCPVISRPQEDCCNCRRDETASCLNFGVTYLKPPETPPHFFGGFADCLYSPAGNLVKFPATLPLDAVAAAPCAGPTVLRACTYAGGLRAGELVVVLGTGPVGLFAIAWAAAAGCHVVAIGSGRLPLRAELAQRLGAREVLDFRASKPADRLARVRALAQQLGHADGADVVLDASGAPAAFVEGLDLVATRGRFIVPGQYSDSGEVAIKPQLLTFKAIRLTGSGQYTLADISAYLRFLAQHPALHAAFAASVAHYPVSQANRAWDDAVQGRTIKAVFSA